MLVGGIVPGLLGPPPPYPHPHHAPPPGYPSAVPGVSAGMVMHGAHLSDGTHLPGHSGQIIPGTAEALAKTAAELNGRAGRSIGVLLRELINCYGQPGTLLDIDDVLKRFPLWKKRRLYDVLAVLTSIRCVEHTAKQVFVWHGTTRVRAAVADFLQRDRAVRPLLDGDEQDVDPDAPAVTVTGLAFLTQQFVLLLRQRAIDGDPGALSFEQAVAQLAKRIKATDEKAVTRRVYDVVNTLEAIGLLERASTGSWSSHSGGFAWRGVNLAQTAAMPAANETSEPVEAANFEGLLRRKQKRKRNAAKRKREEEMAAVLGALSSAPFAKAEAEPEGEDSAQSGGEAEGIEGGEGRDSLGDSLGGDSYSLGDSMTSAAADL